MPSQKPKRRGRRQFGGRATAAGVNYESRIAAYVAVQMLGGEKCVLWENLTGADIVAVTLQTKGAIDDVVIGLRNGARCFVSAKSRSKAIALTKASAAFADTIDSFVQEFAALPTGSRLRNRFVWAVPSTVGAAASVHLQNALNSHRLEAADSVSADFVAGRNRDQRSALEKAIAVIKDAWQRQHKTKPTEQELRDLLRMTFVEVHDFGSGYHHERTAEEQLRAHIVAKSARAPRAWSHLEHVFSRANETGLTVTATSARRSLASDGFILALPPDYAADIQRLRNLTSRNLERLQQHTTLRFGPNAADAIHIPRLDKLNAFAAAVVERDLLMTGEPGCGKSGLIHATTTFLQEKGASVVLLLAEEISRSGSAAPGNLLGLDHPLRDVLTNWANGESGVLITDALDAVRDPEAQRIVRGLLSDARDSPSKWKVAASVREFDLKHGRELREAFPGQGIPNHSSNDFSGVSHFHLVGLSDDELDWLGQQRIEIVPFLDSARGNPRSGALHKSPFYLRLAAELLSVGVTPARLADWNSPAVLLRSFWSNRVEGQGAEQRTAALQLICRQMVAARSMVLSVQEVAFGATELAALNELRSRGILQSPSLLFGAEVGADEIRFSHHLLHDYAIARAYIPTVPHRFCEFARREPLLPIFYRQSFVFALEEIWDRDSTRESFWGLALELEGTANLHGITRILAPIVAARRVEKFGDLEPLVRALSRTTCADEPAQKALRHLASGLQDASAELILPGASAWCEFAERVANLIVSQPFVEGPVTHIIARLNGIDAFN